MRWATSSGFQTRAPSSSQRGSHGTRNPATSSASTSARTRTRRTRTRRRITSRRSKRPGPSPRSVADYWAVNVSSPNTPGLRDLQTPQYLGDLLGAVCDAAGDVPVFVKLSPDLDEDALRETAGAVRASNCRGVIATNTTLERPAGIPAFEGGLSGRPLAARAREVLAGLREHIDPAQVLIAAGGIDSGAEARTRLDAGASLLQIYSALIFAGPALVGTILSDLGDRP